jgi:uncharacterized repeat protein (TIGR03803 family)
MKIPISKSVHLPRRSLARSLGPAALIASLGLMAAGRVTAQTFTTLHSFTALNTNSANSDGAYPVAGLLLSGNTLYGTTLYGGSAGNGTVFAVNTNGTGFTTLHSFTARNTIGDNSDGAFPYGGLILSGSTLYGTAYLGGAHNGTVFSLNTNGSGFATLYSFTNGYDGSEPMAGLVLSGSILYGTATTAGNDGYGSVFALTTNGTGFTPLHSFADGSDGNQPRDALLLSGNTLYGTTWYGGINGSGTVFSLHTDGTSYTVLYNFTCGSDGCSPESGLIISGNTLYGTATTGGSANSGTVFLVKTNGTGFTTLYSFTNGLDGDFPFAGLLLSGSTLYGTAEFEGLMDMGSGTVFALNTNGTGFTTLYTFTGTFSDDFTNSDGAFPEAGLILSGNIFYGTATAGGSAGNGTVFSLSLGPATVTAPQLAVLRSGANVILTWPTNATGFTLQSATNLNPPAVWNTVSPAPAIVNGQNTVTNPIAVTQQFYRLLQGP